MTKTEHLKAEDVRQQMRRALRGEVTVAIRTGDTWDDAYAGNVEFLVGDWKIVVFNDCDSFDYVESAVAPDGREGGYDSWAIENDGRDPDDWSNNNPDRGWTSDERTELVKLFKKAR